MHYYEIGLDITDKWADSPSQELIRENDPKSKRLTSQYITAKTQTRRTSA